MMITNRISVEARAIYITVCTGTYICSMFRW